MIRKVRLLTLVICLCLGLLSPGLVQARNGLAVLNTSVAVDFPVSITFNLSAESDADITDIRLHYMVDRMGFAQVTSEVYVGFEPDTMVETQWVWDMRRTGGLPPGSSIIYWWIVADADLNKVETGPVRVLIEDNRYPWRSLTQGQVTLYWYEGDDAFAGELMTATRQALARLAENTGVRPDKPIKIYIYASSRDLRGSMIYPQEWTGGVAFTRFGILAIGIALGELGWGSRAIAHELTHLTIHQMTFNPYGDLPTWLDEGLAMTAEGELEPVFVALLNGAAAEGKLISVRSLSSPFSAYAEESALAYAQSHSLVEFLIASYGQERMFGLLNTFREGSGYDEALVKVYGFDMDGLDSLWQEHVFGYDVTPVQPVQPVAERGIPPAVIGILAGLATGLFLWLSLFIESWAWHRGS